VVLEDPEELDLGTELEVSDLVEKDRAAMGQFEPPLPRLVGVGEGALDVSEPWTCGESFPYPR